MLRMLENGMQKGIFVDWFREVSVASRSGGLSSFFRHTTVQNKFSRSQRIGAQVGRQL
ncbi:MAG: hypothetical protein H7318_03810 [Oligoflexus sp.]|nr:hypothetical protein [Oligoflexus sp.]